MVYTIILGRSEKDRDKFGTRGCVLLAKQYVKMGPVTSLANPVYLDVTNSHVVFVCGKRGGGKSYTLGVIAEGLSDLPPEIKENISIVILDTMGIYWTMKYPNKQDESLLDEWQIKPHGLDVVIFTPAGYYQKYKEEGIPTDFPFTIKPSELSPEDWFLSFEIDSSSPLGVLIERIVLQLKDQEVDYDLDDLIKALQEDTRSDKVVRDAAENRFLAAKRWGVFSKDGTPMSTLAAGGQVTILDLSAYATMPGGWKIKALVMGIIANRMFIERMKARKLEEYDLVRAQTHFLTEKKEEKKPMPLVWLVIDEAHEFLPNDHKTAASDALITILREGRQPGVSLVMATQQPGKIHTDVMTQSDILLSHRITAKLDTEALGNLMQSYLRSGLDTELNILPRESGAAIAVDDTNERLYPMRVRPRFTWHGGSAPTAMTEKREL